MGLVNFVLGWRELGIRRGDLVLEVGSGGRPFARSDVLVDMFIEDSSERTVAPIVLDRPFVCANAEHLPFKDGVFDFVLSAHLLEHLIYPERFLEEVMRVSKRGHLITPSEFCERILPLRKHLWMVSVDGDGTLILQQKSKPNESNIPDILHQVWLTDKRFRRFFDARPDLFQTRITWEDSFNYEIFRDVERPSWLLKASDQSISENKHSTENDENLDAFNYQTPTQSLRAVLSRGIRRVHSGRTSVDLLPLMACSVCKGDLKSTNDRLLSCVQCGHNYSIRRDGVPVMLAELQ